MTTHDRDKIFAAAKETGLDFLVDQASELLGLFYSIAFESGRQAEREECAIEAEKQAQDEPYGHAKFRCHNIAEAIRARGDTK